MSEAPESGSPYDVLVIGGGPAGLTAGMYAARQGLRCAVVAGEVGGQAAWASRIENYMGWQVVSGRELISHFRDHAARFGVACFEGQLVNAVVPAEGGFEVFTREGLQLKGATLVIATGRAVNRLAVPGEMELLGKGVSYCATCDAAFFVGKPVAVVGPGEAAAVAALQLAKLGAAPVTLVSAKPLRAPDAMLARLAEEGVSVRTGMRVTAIEGTERVTGLTLSAPGASDATETLPVDGVFIETGSIPAGEFTGGLVDTNERGEIVTGRDASTSTPGIFAAGDVTDGLGKQVIIAAGEGARAAVAADRWLKRQDSPASA
jgi:NADH-dependent peroxiredoxin subunit F